nr:immunoglobulin light chain junction region [Macaca mulatta]
DNYCQVWDSSADHPLI